MFTLGNKEAIVNGLGSYKVHAYDASGNEITTYNKFEADGTTPTNLAIDHITVDGYGSFLLSQIVTKNITKAAPATMGSAKLTCPSAAEIGLASSDTNIPTTFLARISTSRMSSEWANDFIKRGRPLVTNIMLNGGDSATVVATKVVAALKAYENAFRTSDNANGSLPFNYSASSSVVSMELKDACLSFDPAVTFIKKWDTFGLTLSGAGHWEAGTTGSFSGVETVDGKYLEENVAMATEVNQDIYGINTGNVPMVLSDLYTEVKWTAKATDTEGIAGTWAPHKNLSTSAADAGTPDRNVSFSLYYNQSAFGDIATEPAEDSTLNSLQKIAWFLNTSLPVT